MGWREDIRTVARDAGDKREGPHTWRGGRKFPPPPQRETEREEE